MQVWSTWVLGDLSAILCYTPCILHVWNFFDDDFQEYFEGRKEKDVKADERNSLEHENSHLRFCITRGSRIPNLFSNKGNSWKVSTYGKCQKQNMMDVEVAIPEYQANEYDSHCGLSLDEFMKKCCNKCKKESRITSTQRHLHTHESHGRTDNLGEDNEISAVSNAHHPPCWGSSAFSIRKFVIRFSECVTLFLLLIGLCMFIFFNLGVRNNNEFVQHLSYLVFPMVIWASFRFNRIGLPLSVVVVAIMASAGTAKHRGPLYHDDNSDNSLLQVKIDLESTMWMF